MDMLALTRILDRVEHGAATATDADALRTIFQPYLRPAVGSPSREKAHRGDCFNPRVGSQATVAISFTRDRYKSGEFQIRTTYRLLDGSVSTDESHRIGFTRQYAPMIQGLWELGFDETVRAIQNEAAVVRLNVACPGLDPVWSETVRTIAVIIGHELHVVVTGTAPDPRQSI